MANRRILAIVTALVLMGTSASSQQAASIAELRQIELLVSNQRWVELYNLVLRTPRLVQGTDPLANELRNFMRQVSLGRVADLAPTSRPPSLELPELPGIGLDDLTPPGRKLPVSAALVSVY